MRTDHPLFPITATTVVVLVLAVAGVRAMPETPTAGVGTEAPVFGGKNAEGAPITLAQFENQVVLLNIWATWCLPCRDEFPSMQRLYGAHEGQGFNVVAIAIDGVWKEERAWKRINQVVDELGLTFTVLHDPNFVTPTRYRNSVVPESWIIDRTGMIVERVLGSQEWDTPEYMDLVAHLISGSPPNPPDVNHYGRRR